MTDKSALRNQLQPHFHGRPDDEPCVEEQHDPEQNPSLGKHESFWRDVWQVLVEECGASEERGSGHGFDSFYRYMIEDHDWWEFRFMGTLAFGGKFHRTRWLHQPDQMRVSCYPEDRTPERVRAITGANDRLARMVAP